MNDDDLALWVVLWACLSVAGGCAGYQIGNRSLYPTDLKTVHVPMFQSDSWRPDLGEWLTEAVIKEIELRTPYKVVSNPLADSVLTGRILWDAKRVISENKNDEPRNLLYNAAVHVTWIDKGGRILTQSVISVGDHFVPEAGQSITTAEETLIHRLAAQIVSEMEAQNW
jgi:hypothetical protein